MKKRLISLVLALVLTLSCFAGAVAFATYDITLAESISTAKEYEKEFKEAGVSTWYKITAAASLTNYRITLSNADIVGGVYATAYQDAKTKIGTVHANRGELGIIDVTPTPGAVFYICISRADSDKFGSYKLSVDALPCDAGTNETNAMNYPLNSTGKRQLDTKGIMDWYKITTTSRLSNYSFELENLSITGDATLTIIDIPSKRKINTLAIARGATGSIDLNLPKNTSYLITVSRDASDTDVGEYKFTAYERVCDGGIDIATAMALPLNALNAKSFDVKGVDDWFKITTNDALRYTLTLDNSGVDSSITAAVYDSNKTLVGQVSAELGKISEHQLSLKTKSVYYIRVNRKNANMLGKYTLALTDSSVDAGALLSENKTSFGSTVSKWAKAEVEEAHKLGLIPASVIGTDLTLAIDRAEFAAVAVALYRKKSGKATSFTQNPFTDINANRNQPSIIAAYHLGITAGTSETTFSPTVKLSREQLATMLCRTYKKLKFDKWTLATDGRFSLDTSGVAKFADDANISDYAKQSVYFLTKHKIISGVGNNKFAPKNTTAAEEKSGYATATREQAILLALRIYNSEELFK